MVALPPGIDRLHPGEEEKLEVEDAGKVRTGKVPLPDPDHPQLIKKGNHRANSI